MTLNSAQTIHKYYRIDRREIAWLRFVLEGYEGLAVLSTVNARNGEICLQVPSGFLRELEALMQSLQTEILLEPLEKINVH